MNTILNTRLYRPEEDLYALTELINTVQGSNFSIEEMNQQMSWHGHNPAQDRYIAFIEEKMVGTSMRLAQSEKRHFVEASVHPDFRRQGIGRALLERVMEDARQHGAQQVTGAFGAQDQAAQRFAQACGFTMAGEVRFFTAPANRTFPAPVLPDGFTIQTGAEFKDLQIYADGCNRCYHDMWGHYENLQPLTVERIEQRQIRSPEIFSQDRLLVILAPDGSPAGVTRIRLEGEGDSTARFIDAPGVAPEYRYLGLQRTLVAAAATRFDRGTAGRYEIQTWGDTQDAVKIYEEMGFLLDKTTHSFEYVRYLQP